MLVEKRRDIILGCLWPSYPLAFTLGVLHSGANTRPDDGQFQLCKHCRHLDEGLRHRINLATTAVHRDAAHNDQAQFLMIAA